MARHYASTRFPTSPAELAECLADEPRFQEIFPDSAQGAWDEFARVYARVSPIIKEQMAVARQEAAQQAAAEAAAGAHPRIPIGGKAQGKRGWKKKPPGVCLDSLMEGYDRPLASFLNAVRGGPGERVQELRSELEDRPRNAGMSERIPGGGGFLVPETLRDEILMATLEKSIVRPLARIIPMDSLRVPLPIIDDTSHVQNVYGGVAGYWCAEGATLAATAPAWGRIDLEARKLTAYTTIPNELLEDSVTPLDEWFNLFFPRAMAWFEDMAFINGTGVGEPEGYINSQAAVKVATNTSHVIAFPDLVGVYARIYPECLTSPSLRWVMSPDARAQLLTMTYSASTAVSPPPWLPSMQVFDEPDMRIFGIPVCMSEKVPSSLSGNTTTAGAIGLVDFGYYTLGDRQSMQIAVSEEYLFASDQVAYRVIERLDGRIWQSSPISPANGSDQTLSSVVLCDTTS